MPRPGIRALALVGLPAVLSMGVSVSCLSDANPGFDPPPDALHFPAGLTLDPRVSQAPLAADCDDGSACTDAGGACVAGVCREPAARWMFVTNSNSDLRYNASSLSALNLEKFHCYRQGGQTEGCEAYGEIPALRDPDEPVTAERPCRPLATKPSVIECTEGPFIDESATVNMGHFPTVIAGLDPGKGDDEARLLIPVRGDPSITWMDISGGLAPNDGDPSVDIECGQGEDPDERDKRKCGDDHRVTRLLDDPDLPRIGAEPINILVSQDESFAYVTHSADPDLSLVALKDLGDPSDPGDDRRIRPLLVDQKLFMVPSNLQILPGSLGLAERPCDGDDPPNISRDCARPLVYAAMRYERNLIAASVYALDPDTDLESYQSCVEPEDLGTPGGILCESQFDFEARFFAGGVSPSEFAGPPQLGDLAFSADGNTLFAVQTNPGALLRIDTSVDTAGNIRDIPAGQVELCPRATAMKVYRDGQDDYALVTCYRSAAIFVVDLNSLNLVATIQPGTGPHHMAVDLARELVYVGNTLEASISVIDMSRDSDSRFSEIARLGLQEPFSND